MNEGISNVDQALIAIPAAINEILSDVTSNIGVNVNHSTEINSINARVSVIHQNVKWHSASELNSLDPNQVTSVAHFIAIKTLRELSNALIDTAYELHQAVEAASKS